MAFVTSAGGGSVTLISRMPSMAEGAEEGGVTCPEGITTCGSVETGAGEPAGDEGAPVCAGAHAAVSARKPVMRKAKAVFTIFLLLTPSLLSCYKIKRKKL